MYEQEVSVNVRVTDSHILEETYLYHRGKQWGQIKMLTKHAAAFHRD